ncbi:hypothetical protein [Phycicoccus sp. 3266]|uniref:hypothetical protein n=1 Tax=Phycicoccus sp. 3266 TaxID=2817751 RepID=UPI00285BC5FB|nr:hypothetical protein [Phycicoccus sp. 3266]MDR6862679.1 multidrug efflux pump subunit AcrA (membrane-fusion protein) [Phycicoccus sp. 3266]
MPAVMPADLTFSQTLWSNALGALFTALFVTLGAGVLVRTVEDRQARSRLDAENSRQESMRKADEARADALAKADQERAAALLLADQQRADALTKAETERADLRRQLDKEHDERQQARDHEFQSRAALRESYTELLVAQRRSREASKALAESGDISRIEAGAAASKAHDEFIDVYHRLALDADRPMWLELRSLRAVLDDMVQAAASGDLDQCTQLAGVARDARQNLERSFRARLGHEPLQDRHPLGRYEKGQS